MVKGQWLVSASKEAVWNMLTNPEHLVASVDNVIESRFFSKDDFYLTVNVDTGLGWATYNFHTHMQIDVESEHLYVDAVGVNGQNVVEFRADVWVQGHENHTYVMYEISAKARGGLASVAQRTVCDVIVSHVDSWLQNALKSAQVII